jgi:hypothetical protein
MVFLETIPPALGSVWLKDIRYMMPPVRVTRHEVDSVVEGEKVWEWHVNIEIIESC